MNFESIKEMPAQRYSFSSEEYLVFGKEFLINMDRANIDCWGNFENDTFKIVPFDWDGLQDCNCYFDKEREELYSNGATDEELDQYEETHMHDINCITRDTNFYHKPTGISVNWYKHVDRFHFINKKITFDEWTNIVQDCVSSVKKEKYTTLINEVYLNEVINFGNHGVTRKEFNILFDKFIKSNGWTTSEEEYNDTLVPEDESAYYEGEHISKENFEKLDKPMSCYICCNIATQVIGDTPLCNKCSEKKLFETDDDY